MRVFLAGAAGAIGRQLLPMLLREGHKVVGTTRSPRRAAQIEAAGAQAVVVDALDAEALTQAVAQAAPEALIHELTSLPQRIDPRTIARDFAANDRLRTEGTRNLLAASRAAGVGRIIVQSIAFSYAPGPPGTVHVESDPLVRGQDTLKSFARSAEALRELERVTLRARPALRLLLRPRHGPQRGRLDRADGPQAPAARRRRGRRRVVLRAHSRRRRRDRGRAHAGRPRRLQRRR